jgi:hypothetical protein
MATTTTTPDAARRTFASSNSPTLTVTTSPHRHPSAGSLLSGIIFADVAKALQDLVCRIYPLSANSKSQALQCARSMRSERPEASRTLKAGDPMRLAPKDSRAGLAHNKTWRIFVGASPARESVEARPPKLATIKYTAISRLVIHGPQPAAPRSGHGDRGGLFGVLFWGHSRKGTRAPAGERNTGAIGADTIAKPSRSRARTMRATLAFKTRRAAQPIERRGLESSGNNRPPWPLDTSLRWYDDQERRAAPTTNVRCQVDQFA